MLKEFFSNLIVDRDVKWKSESSVLTIKPENRELEKNFIVKRYSDKVEKTQNPFMKYFEDIDSLYNCKAEDNIIRYNRKSLSQSRCYNR